jgi:small subunit ribosomal protein S8
MTDSIADYLTRLRNAMKAKHRLVEIPSSGLKKEITRILLEKGYIVGYKVEDIPGHRGIIKIALKYSMPSRLPVIKEIQRVSRPGLRRYVPSSNLPRILNGLGVAILSTSKGVMTDKEARTQNVGGEVICYVY